MGGPGCQPLAVFPSHRGARSRLRFDGRARFIRTGEPSCGNQATVPSVIAGMRAVKPGASQRTVEWAMVEGCWQAMRPIPFGPGPCQDRMPFVPRSTHLLHDTIIWTE